MLRSTLVVAALALAVPATAQEDFSAQLKARQGQFRILALNLGILGGMAKGEIDYDSETAQSAADSIAAVTGIHQPILWPEGSSNLDREGTRALPEIWDDFSDFQSKFAALGEQAEAMQQVAATGQEALGPAMGQLGNACKNCHDTYRQPQ
ncbi:c-type cytochrome [Roseivivax sp. CAU 1761]